MAELDALTKAYLKQVSSEKPSANYTMQDRLASPSGLVGFYKNQLRKFNKLGIGNKTEFNVTVTPSLIKITIQRLEEIYKRKLSGSRT